MFQGRLAWVGWRERLRKRWDSGCYFVWECSLRCWGALLPHKHHIILGRLFVA